MFIQLTPDARVADVQAELQGLGLWTRSLVDVAGVIRGLTVAESSAVVPRSDLLGLPGVADVLDAVSRHPRVDAQAGRPVTCGSVRLGPGAPPVLMAGPCAVESAEQIHAAAAVVARAGGHFLRGGAYKPRTSPYSFDGHGEKALRWMRAAADENGLLVLTELMSERADEAVSAYADMLQIGARNMQNFALLAAAGATGKPVLLKRGLAATIEEWLLAGEHLLAAGAAGVVFCERGIRGTDPATRFLLDLSAVALLSHIHRQPVVCDPSHGTGRRDLVPVMSRTALTAGAHGLLVEVHPDAREAQSDGPQALDPATLIGLRDLFQDPPRMTRPEVRP